MKIKHTSCLFIFLNQWLIFFFYSLLGLIDLFFFFWFELFDAALAAAIPEVYLRIIESRYEILSHFPTTPAQNQRPDILKYRAKFERQSSILRRLMLVYEWSDENTGNDFEPEIVAQVYIEGKLLGVWIDSVAEFVV